MRKPLKVYPYITLVLIVALATTQTLSQTTCNNGQGRVLYERLPNQQLQGFDDDVVRDSSPPFRVLEKCQDLCLRDRTASNNLVRACTSFDFQPGSRIASFSGSAEYEESTCYLTREQATPEGIGNLMLVPNSVHFTEICLSSSRPERECPSRRYVFERYPRKKLKLPVSDIKEITAANRSDCEDKCLNEFSFVCRSANFDSTLRSCTLSRFTRRTHPELLEDDPNSDYLENTCLNAERRCDGLVVFVKEENKKLGGPFEVDIFTNVTLEECQSMCLRAEKYFCRSVEYDEQTKQCILSEEDSISQKDDLSISSSPTHHFYDLVCLDNQRGTEYPDNSVTSHLFSNGRRPDTAFQRYRNSRLGGEFHSEITGRSLSECLDECLRQTSFQCRSAVYSDRFRTCRLSRYNQRDGMRIIYDADYDYYENLMLGNDGEQGSTRPDDWHSTPHGSTDRERFPDDRPGRYPGQMPPNPQMPGRFPPYDRYGPQGNGGGPPGPRPDFDRFPTSPGPDYGTDRYNYMPDRFTPTNRYPQGGERYPAGTGADRYPQTGPGDPYDNKYPPVMSNRYPDDDRYGPSMYPDNRNPPSRGHPVERPPTNKYPDMGSMGGSRYPPPPPVDTRYPAQPIDTRYPVDTRFPAPDSRYPAPDNRYPTPDTRYPAPDNRYPTPDTRYPAPDNRYPMAMSPGYYGGQPNRVVPGDPDTAYNVRYPNPMMGMGLGPESKYPSPSPPRYPASENRFPVGNDRFPMNVYKYGNQNPNRYGPGMMMGFDNRFGPMPVDMGDRTYGAGGDRFGMNRGPPQRPPPPYIMVGFGNPQGGYGPQDFDNTIGGPDNMGYGNQYGPPGPQRPISTGTRCDETDSYKQMGLRQKMRKQFVRRSLQVPSLIHCQRECSGAKDFICRSFNYRDSPASFDSDRTSGPPTAGGESFNCELSDRDTRELDVHNPMMFDPANSDFYERSMAGRNNDGDCLDVAQVCNEDGMEFTLRTPEGFVGRIYSYGFYDRCFFRGNGGTINVLRISGPQGYPECGTQRYADTITAIIVVQFSDNVQTGRDKRFNLTCLFRGPGESVVTSGYIGAGSGSPIPIEYLPAENSMSSKVRLMILYQGRPTTTIAVGDPLTFRLESQDGYSHVNDIFATNVVARDPYSGRSVQLIDRYGCPVDTFVFPELGRSRDGDSLEARFNAFKIPESNFLVFEATVRTCRDGCQPAYCNGLAGRSEQSYGRKRRSVNGTLSPEGNNTIILDEISVSENGTEVVDQEEKLKEDNNFNDEQDVKDFPEQVREMIEVFESREEMQQESIARKFIATQESICLSPSEYYGLVTSIIMLILLLITVALVIGFIYRRYWSVIVKNRSFDCSSPAHSYSNHMTFSNASRKTFSSNKDVGSNSSNATTSLFGGGLQKTFATGNLARICQIPVITKMNNNSSEFDDPSEPIYTDPSLFERSRI